MRVRSSRLPRGLVVATLLALCGAAPAGSTQAATPGRIDFARDVWPILRASCFSCHGALKRSGQLRLDTRRSALRGGSSGPVIVPGNSGQSLLYQLLVASDPDDRMPQRAEALPPHQTAIVRAWIDQGAPWPDPLAGDEVAEEAVHWAYRKPVSPTVPTYPRFDNAIDAFVVARLEREGLKPSDEAPRETLLRRLSLDLTGLPPSPDEIAAFVADRSPRAYEKRVEKLLASPRYGERWARPWLDLARFADTNGHEKDRRRSIWMYRDWVIAALNRDLPFDDFTVQQLAGDLLPGATRDTLVATGFHRNTMFNEEAGVDPDESLYETIVDRVNTTATVWLGSTLACAQCHNHKYDPFSQRDYFRFYAFFANARYDVKGRPGSSFVQYVEPVLELPSPAQERRRRALLAEIADLERKMAARGETLAGARAAWEARVLAAANDFEVMKPVAASSSGGSTLTREADGSVLVSGTNPREDTYVVSGVTNLDKATALRIEALTDARLPKGGPGRDIHGNFLLNEVELRVSPLRGGPEAATRVEWTDAVADDHGSDVHGPLPAAHLLHDTSRGFFVDMLNDDVRRPRAVVLVAGRPFGFPGGTRVEVRIRQASPAGGQGLGRFRLSLTASTRPTTVVQAPPRLRPLLQVPEARRPAAEQAKLVEHYRSIAPALAALRAQRARAGKALADLDIPSTLVLGERDSPETPSARVRVRGAFLDKGEQVTAAVPAALPPLPPGVRPDRLALARWLVDADNPLTARVTVNRVWELYFGRGLVETSEDFGTQGARPSHPELLDWLATRFVAGGWRLKDLHRLIVTSATYRQSSRVTPALLERDPFNRLLARGPRFRLEGETIRDLSLAASGLLSEKIGGPSVFPFQPEGIWDIPYSSDTWRDSKGDDRYRRSIYTFWRRTSPYPSLVTFDAASRETCSVRRVRTNTPLQALTTLNDPAFFAAARALGRRMAREAGPDVGARLAHGFRLAAGRSPRAEESAVLRELHARERARLASDARATEALGGARAQPSDAALVVVANVILNLDEVLNKN